MSRKFTLLIQNREIMTFTVGKKPSIEMSGQRQQVRVSFPLTAIQSLLPGSYPPPGRSVATFSLEVLNFLQLSALLNSEQYLFNNYKL